MKMVETTHSGSLVAGCLCFVQMLLIEHMNECAHYVIINYTYDFHVARIAIGKSIKNTNIKNKFELYLMCMCNGCSSKRK